MDINPFIKLEMVGKEEGYKQKIIQFIRRNQVYFSSSNVSTDTTVIVKDYMLSEKFRRALYFFT